MSALLTAGCFERQGYTAPLGSIPIDPTNVVAEPLSSSRIALTWTASPSPGASHILAYQQGDTAPVDCVSGTAIPAAAFTGTGFIARGLSAATSYSFRVCAVARADATLISPGGTALAATLAGTPMPPCDDTIAPGAYDNTAVQARLDALELAGTGDDSLKTLCLSHGVVATLSTQLFVPGNDYFIGAADGDSAIITSTDDGFEIFGRTNIALHNLQIDVRTNTEDGVEVEAGSSEIELTDLRISTTGDGGSGVQIVDSTVRRLAGLQIQTSGTGSAAIYVSASSVDVIETCELATTGRGSAAIELTSGVVGDLSGIRASTAGVNAPGIWLAAGSRVDQMLDVVLIRSSVYSPNSAGVLFDATGSGPSWVGTAALASVRICASLAQTKWEQPFADTIDAGVTLTIPTRQISDTGGGLGAETFPFDDAFGSTTGTDQNVTFADQCGPLVPEQSVTTSMNFADLQAVLDAAHIVGDTTGDGLIAIRLADGVTVRNTDSLGHPRIVVPGSNFYLYADAADVAVVASERDTRAGTEDDDNGIFFVDDVHNISFVNLTLETLGHSGDPVFCQLGTLALLTDLRVSARGFSADFHIDECHVHEIARVAVESFGEEAEGLLLTQSSADIIADVDIVTHGLDAQGLTLVGATIKRLERLSVVTDDVLSSSISMVDDSSIWSFVGPSHAETRGQFSHGIYLADSSSILALDDIVIVRGAAATGNAVGILAVPSTLPGTNNYFDSANVSNVTVCSAGAQAWESAGSLLVADGDEEGAVDLWVTPAAHVPHPTGLNAETFPFSGPAAQLQGITMGGGCP